MILPRVRLFVVTLCLLFGSSMSLEFETRCFDGLNSNRCLRVPIIETIDKGCQCSMYGFTINLQQDDACTDFILEAPKNYNLGLSNVTLKDMMGFHGHFIDVNAFMLYLTEFSSCTTINTTYGTVNITMIRTCPIGEHNKTLVNLCEDAGLTSGLPPIENTGVMPIVFRNVYCAFCHNISMEYIVSSVKLWTPKLVCDEEALPKYWSTIQSNLKLGKCAVHYAPPELGCGWDSYFLYEVYDLLEIECQKCINATSSNASNTIYLTASSPSCLKCIFVRKLLASDCWPSPSQGGSGTTALFDIPSDEEILISINGGLFKTNEICKHDEQFDVLMQSCRQFVCPNGQVPRKGQCIRNNTMYLDPESQPLDNGTNILYITIAFNRNSDDYFNLNNWINLIKEESVYTFGSEVVENIIFTGRNPQVLQFTFNSSAASIREVLTYLRYLPHNIMYSELTFSIKNYHEVSPVDVQCGVGAYVCTNGSDSASALGLRYKEATIFAEVTIQNKTLRIPLENSLFQIYVSNIHYNISLDTLCYCEPPKLEILTNCSFTMYLYHPHEYRIDEDGKLKLLLNQDLTYEKSEYVIRNSFAFVCYNPDAALAKFFNFDPIQNYVSWVCSGLSIGALFVTISMYAFLKELRNLPGKLTMGLSILLVSGQILLLIPDVGKEICTYLAALTHFTWLSVFMWMGAIAINMLVTFHPKTMHGSSLKNGSMFKKYAISCFLVPGILCVTLLTLDLVPGDHLHVQYGVVTCTWMAEFYGYIGMFFIPIGLILILNIICFGLTLYYIEHTMTASDKVTGRKRDRDRCVIYIKLSSVMGFTWIFGYVASFADAPVWWYVYIVFNGLQGVFIFLSFSLNSRSRQMVVDRFSRVSKYRTTTNSSQVNTTSTKN